MEYLDIDSINAAESGPIALRNYLTYLCLKDEKVKRTILENSKKIKEDFKNIKDNLEINREIRSIEFARKMKEYGFLAEMQFVDFKGLEKYKKSFPMFACLRNSDVKDLYVLIYDITSYGVVVKDEKYNDRVINLDSFKQAYFNRLIEVKDYSLFFKKYISKKKMDSFAHGNNLDAEDIFEGVLAIIALFGS